MKTIIEHLDDLDRMVDSGSAPKHEIRSQIAFIGKLVVALEHDYMSSVDGHTQTTESKAKVEAELAELKARNQKLTDNWIEKEANERMRIIQSKQLHP